MLDRVTITGADDNTPIEALNELALGFPFVEFGILVSKKRQGSARYPSHEWLYNLEARVSARVQLSMHVCGSWSQQIFRGGMNWSEIHAGLFGSVRRVQINGVPNSHWSTVSLDPISGRDILFQVPSNQKFLAHCRRSGFKVFPLQDQSGGRGEEHEWKDVCGDYIGFAGGIGPQNVSEKVANAKAITKERFWIDMEGQVRTDDRLDLVKVRDVLEICKPLVSL